MFVREDGGHHQRTSNKGEVEVAGGQGRGEGGHHRVDGGHHRVELGHNRVEGGHHRVEGGHHRVEGGHHRVEGGHHRLEGGHHQFTSTRGDPIQVVDLDHDGEISITGMIYTRLTYIGICTVYIGVA